MKKESVREVVRAKLDEAMSKKREYKSPMGWPSKKDGTVLDIPEFGREYLRKGEAYALVDLESKILEEKLRARLSYNNGKWTFSEHSWYYGER